MIVVLAVLFEKTKLRVTKMFAQEASKAWIALIAKKKRGRDKKTKRLAAAGTLGIEAIPFSSKSLYSTPKFLRIFLLHYHLNSTLPELICQNALGFNSIG